jgi:kynurenine formamidase
MQKLITVFLLVISMGAEASDWIDLSYSFDEKTIYWPSGPGFKIEKTAGFTKDGYYYAANTFCAPEHGGTHIDAPIHFSKPGKTVDELSSDDLMVQAVLIDLEHKVKDDADYEISQDDISDWEKANGSIKTGSLVIFRTGWGKYWGDKKRYLGSNQAGDLKNLHFPGISEKAARYLAKLEVKGVGLDTASLDYGQSRDFKAHRILLGKNIYGLENLANLDKLDGIRFEVIVAPLKIKGGTGAPTRVFVRKNK